MKALFQMIFSHKELKEQKVEANMSNHQTVFGTKGQKGLGGECMEVGMNESTVQRSNDSTGAREAEVA